MRRVAVSGLVVCALVATVLVSSGVEVAAESLNSGAQSGVSIPQPLMAATAGGPAASSLTVTSSGQAPVAVISVSASTGAAPFAVDLNGSNSTDVDGVITDYEWDFGDGTFSFESVASGVSVSHTYAAPGSYTAVLTVTDDQGLSSSSSQVIDVTVNPGAVISNGLVMLGVNGAGNLVASDVGLKFIPTDGDAITPGCACEGWGVADSRTRVSGWANQNQGGTSNLIPVSFDSTATTATAVSRIGETFRVTHVYRPSTRSANLFEVRVTVENISPEAVDLRYRRVMDWDVPPQVFNEYVTIMKGNAAAVVATSDNGFALSDPLEPAGSILFTGEAVDSGPHDHGALFDFDFGELAPGQAREFTTYYGAAPDEMTAKQAIRDASIEAYSF